MDTTKDTRFTYLQNTNNYPTAKAPISPVISYSTFSGSSENSRLSIGSLKFKRFVTSGRVATALALINENIGIGDEVLIPAYHCESMVAPVRHTGAETVFYSIQPDTMIDMSSINRLLTAKTRAIIVTHFFGFTQDVLAIRKFCDEHRLIMIEDCAHSFFGSSGGKTIGYYADYAIASTMKFYPVFDGGILASNRHNLDNIYLKKASLHLEVKALLTIIERAISFNRLSYLGKAFGLVAKIKDHAWSTIKSIFFKHRKAYSIGPSAAEGGFSFDPIWLTTEATRVSRYIINSTNDSEIIQKRRERYLRYSDALKNIKGCRLIHKQLGDFTTPVVVPVHFDNCSEIFKTLKLKGIPIWHFGEFLDPLVTPSTCQVSYEYSHNVIQFPCHQELTDEEITWIIKEIVEACETLN